MNNEDKFIIKELATIRTFCMNSDKEDVYRYIYSLQQENKQLKGAIETYDILLKTNVKSSKVLEELKKWLEEQVNFDIYDGSGVYSRTIQDVLDKIKELEEGVK